MQAGRREKPSVFGSPCTQEDMVSQVIYSLAVNAKEVVRLLEQNGWSLDRQRGSHAHFVNPGKPGRITSVPMKHGDLKKGTLKNIERQSGVRLR